MTTRTGQPVIVFRREHSGGQQSLVGELTEPLPAGARLHLLQLHHGERVGCPQFVVHHLPPAAPHVDALAGHLPSDSQTST